MKDLDLTPLLMSKMKSYPRKRGRYNASELFAIDRGWTTPETWMRPKERTPEEVMRMWRGVLVHDHIQRLLPSDTNEIKKEYHWNGIVLVGKSDNLPKKPSNEVWEFKTSDQAFEKGKPWHLHQIRLYTTMFEREKGILFQPVSNEQGLFLKRIGEVERDDDWFQKQLQKLWIFHMKVEKLWEKM